MGALQALHILLEPIDNANGQHLRSHHCKGNSHTCMCAALHSFDLSVKASHLRSQLVQQLKKMVAYQNPT